MINCIIVDDEQHAIDILEHYTKQTPQVNLLGSFTNPVEALHFIENNRVDLAFLDIQMPGLTGIEMIKAIQGKCKVVLTTAYSEFAMEGYELYVVDYLLKPIRLPRFLAAVQKAREQLQSASLQESTPEPGYIFVKTESKGKLIKINLADIDYIESMKDYVAVHRGAEKTLVLITMKKLEESLPKKDFIRVHKSFIVPIAKITGIEGNLIRLKNVKAEILMGDSYKAELMEIIKGRMIQ
jgi:two-component system LytT family response regulator